MGQLVVGPRAHHTALSREQPGKDTFPSGSSQRAPTTRFPTAFVINARHEKPCVGASRVCPRQAAPAVGRGAGLGCARLVSAGPAQPLIPGVCVCFQGVLHHHGEVGHQHQGRRQLAEPGAERVHSHPLRRHHGGVHQGTGEGRARGQEAPRCGGDLKAPLEPFGPARWWQRPAAQLEVKEATCVVSALVPPGGRLEYCSETQGWSFQRLPAGRPAPRCVISRPLCVLPPPRFPVDAQRGEGTDTRCRGQGDTLWLAPFRWLCPLSSVPRGVRQT